MTPSPRRPVRLALAPLFLLLWPLAGTAQEVRRLGPAGGGGGAPFADGCSIAAVLVNAGWWIDGVQVLCRDGRAHPLRGGTGGGHHRFDLQPGERIVAVSGWTLGNSGPGVYGIEFHTDRRSSGMFGNGGTEKGRNPFRFDVPAGWELRGLVGRADGSALQAVGIEVMRSPPPAPVAHRVGPVGGGGGAAFEDACPVAGFNVNAGWWIDGIQVVCAGGGTGVQRGGTGGSRHAYRVPAGARITSITGRVDGSYGGRVYSLQVHTDRGSSPVYGGQGTDPGRTPFVLGVPDGYTLVGIFGRADDALGALGIQVAGGFAPPPSGGPVPPRLGSPRAGERMDNGCDGADGVDWRFSWAPVPGAAAYHLWVAREGSANPMVNEQVSSTEYARSGPGYIAAHNLGGWSWRVRSLVSGAWSQWSEQRPFDVEPPGTDCGR